MCKLWHAMLSVFHFLPISNVPVATLDDFSLATISESIIDSEEAHFTLMIDSSVFTVTNDHLELSSNCGGGGSGFCGIVNPTLKSVDLTCTALSGGTSYNLTVGLSVGANCLVFLISFDTPPVNAPPVKPSSMVTDSSGTCM